MIMSIKNILSILYCVSFMAGCAAPAKVLMRIQGEPGEALVTVNDRYIGKLKRLSRRGIKLAPGAYRISVEQPGYFPHDQQVQLAEDETPTLQIQLTPIPD